MNRSPVYLNITVEINDPPVPPVPRYRWEHDPYSGELRILPNGEDPSHEDVVECVDAAQDSAWLSLFGHYRRRREPEVTEEQLAKLAATSLDGRAVTSYARLAVGSAP